ncbi:MAG: TorF family putative porin [Pseudomonadota bacterium]
MTRPSTLRTLILIASGAAAMTASAEGGEYTANVGVTNNYIWRGLTQSENVAAVQGGIDYAAGNGFYIGTWASNVSYAPGDVFSYEHDVYFGFSGESGDLSYDVGYLYYNYDEEAEFDFGEIYGSIGYGNFSATLNILANTEADEAPGQDFGFGQAYYLSLDYGTTVGDGVELGFHVGYHDGDFNEAFNGVPGSYTDFNVSLAKNGFSFMITGTDLDDAGPEGLDNDAIKFVVGYSMDFEL